MRDDARARALFLTLCDLPPAEQAAALAAPDLTADLRAQVAEMLAIDRAEDDPLPVGGGQAILQATEGLPEAPPPEIPGYRIIRALGVGGMGVVFEAEQAHPRRRVALKLPHLHLHSPQLLAQFRAEAQALADLRHPAIPTVFEAGVADGQPFLAMAQIEGQPLYAAAAALPLPARGRLLRQLCDGVAHAHAKGVVHRDIKPSNVLVDADGAVHIVDFGLATAAGATTAQGGTPRYMAPERSAAGRADPRADVYALGYVIWEIVQGTPAPDSRPLPPLEEARDLDWVVARATATAPAARYPDAAGLVEELDRWLAHRPVQAGPPRPIRRLTLWARRHRPWMLAVLGLALLALGVIAGLTLRARQAVADRESRAASRLVRMQEAQQRLRAQGAHARADAIFEAFVGLPEHANTQALAQAWLRRAEEARSAERSAEHRRALARAYSAAPDSATRSAALEALANTFADRWDWDALEVALDRLTHERGSLPDHMVPLRRSARLIRGDLRGALTTAPAGWRPVLRHLSQATPTAHSAFEATRGPAGLVLTDQQHRRFAVVAPQPDLPLKLAIPLEDAAFTGFGWPGVRWSPAPTVVGWQAGEVSVDALDLDTGARRRLADFADDRPLAMTWRRCHDRATLHVGTGPDSRHLLSLDPPGGPPRPAHPASEPLASDVDALLPIDLDGDGCQELVVARGAWTAYELSVLGETADGTLRELDGARLGALTALAALPGPRIVASKTDRYINGLAWADPSRRGETDGLHVFAWADGLVPVARLPLPRSSAPGRRASAGPIIPGDLDGDGLVDLAVRLNATSGDHLWLARQVAPDRFESIVIRGVVPLLATQLDADPAAELIVRAVADDRTWVLGAGDAPFPVQPHPPSAAAPGPTALGDEGPLHAAAQRSETLAELGLAKEGAAQIATLAHLADDPAVRRTLLERSANLYATSGAHRDALRIHRTLAGETDRPRAALTGQARSEQALHLFRAAHQTLTRAGDDAGATGLAPLLPTAEPFTLDPASPLTNWRLDAPHLLRPTADGLRFDLFNRRGTVATRPLERVGPWLAFEVDLVLHRAELGSGIEVALLDGETPLLASALLVNGGGDRSDHALVGTDPLGRRTWRLVRSPGVGATVQITLRASWRIDTGAVLFETRYDGIRQWVQPQGAGVEPGRAVGRALTLAIRSRDLRGWIAPAALSGRITRLTVEGARAAPGLAVVPAAPSPALDALALARIGDLAGAAERLRAAPDDETLLEVLRLAPNIALAARPPQRTAALRHLLAAWRGAWRHRALESVRRLLRDPALADLPGETADERACLYARIALALEQGVPDRADTITARLLAKGPPDADLLLLAARVHADQPAARDWARRFSSAVGSPRVARARLARHGLGHLLAKPPPFDSAPSAP